MKVQNPFYTYFSCQFQVGREPGAIPHGQDGGLQAVLTGGPVVAWEDPGALGRDHLGFRARASFQGKKNKYWDSWFLPGSWVLGYPMKNYLSALAFRVGNGYPGLISPNKFRIGCLMSVHNARIRICLCRFQIFYFSASFILLILFPWKFSWFGNFKFTYLIAFSRIHCLLFVSNYFWIKILLCFWKFLLFLQCFQNSHFLFSLSR